MKQVNRAALFKHLKKIRLPRVRIRRKKKETHWEEESFFIPQNPSKENNKKEEQKISELIECSSCNKVFTITKNPDEQLTLSCPHCGHKLSTQKQKDTKKQDQSSKQKKITKQTIKKFFTDNIVEVILLIIGLFYLIQPTPNNIKISFTLILISTILLFLMTGEQSTTKIKKTSTTKPYFKRKLHPSPILKKIRSTSQRIRDIPLSNRISIVLILWTLLLFIITADVEIYFILIFIGVLITRELTDVYTSDHYKKRLNAYIVIFLLSYIILISQKIMEILSS